MHLCDSLVDSVTSYPLMSPYPSRTRRKTGSDCNNSRRVVVERYNILPVLWTCITESVAQMVVMPALKQAVQAAMVILVAMAAVQYWYILEDQPTIIAIATAMATARLFKSCPLCSYSYAL